MKLEIDNHSCVDVETRNYKTFYLTATGNNGNQIVINDVSRKHLIQLQKDIAIMVKRK